MTPSWVGVCAFDRLLRDRGVCALVGTRQVAVFRTSPDDAVHAISNYDPFSRAFVISRGIVGSKGDSPKVASPVYKHTFDLRTGRCFEDPTVRLRTYPARVRDGLVEIAFPDEDGEDSA